MSSIQAMSKTSDCVLSVTLCVARIRYNQTHCNNPENPGVHLLFLPAPWMLLDVLSNRYEHYSWLWGISFPGISLGKMSGNMTLLKE